MPLTGLLVSSSCAHDAVTPHNRTCRFDAESGSAAVEFVMVSVILVALTAAVLQFALVLHVRNTILDAASEGARWASLSDQTIASGVARTRSLISSAVGEEYARHISARKVILSGVPAVEVRVRTTLPLAGLLGVEKGIEVMGHAPIE